MPNEEINPVDLQIEAPRFHKLEAWQLAALAEMKRVVINPARNFVIQGDPFDNVFAGWDQAVEAKPELPKYEIFWGGADVDPSFYNRPRSKMCDRSAIAKDTADRLRMEELIKDGVPIIGICRGAQLLNVVNGGILVQHIDGHAIGKEHSCIEVATGKEYSVSSTHHQMMIAHQDGQILFKDYVGTDGVHWDDVDEPFFYSYVTEVVYYPKTKSLCIQPHPEWMKQDSLFVRWINDFIKKEWNLGPINLAAEEAAFLRR